MHHVPVLAGIFATSFVVAFSGALMPGPLLAVTIAESGKRGFVAGPLLIAGHAILEVGMVAVLLLGIGPLLCGPGVAGSIGVAGAAVLAWMAVGLIRATPSLRLGNDHQSKAPSGLHPVLRGILTSISNPYWTIWWVTIGLGYVTMSLKMGWAGIAAFFVGHILADLVWYSGVSYGFSHGARFISDRLYRAIMLVCAALLVVFGSWFGYDGASRLSGLLFRG